jgi:outer membrane protein OmpA-like peptidoglycan-associated protein
MKTLAIKNTVNESLTGGHKTVKPAQAPVSPLDSLPIAFPYIQRKPLCACDGGCPSCTGVIQTKLTIGQPNDKYEQEADQVADQVMRMPDPQVQRKAGSSSCGDLEEEQIQTKPISDRITPLVQRQVEEEEEEEVQTKLNDNNQIQRQEEEPEEEEEEPVQAKPLANKSPPIANSIQRRIQSIKGSGQPLSQSVRAFFEPRFGRKLGSVRIHTDAQAGRTAKLVRAKAFTSGKDIVFGNSQYKPETENGRRLLAHELVHVFQQGTNEGYCQRFVSCESSEACPARVRGELWRSRRNAMVVGSVTNSHSGFLVANFAVDSGVVKPDLHSNTTWTSLAGQMAANPNIHWDILGFSDCHGSESTNLPLRRQRATAVYNALPQRARNQVTSFRGASIGDCIAANTTEQGRMYNRSAFIRQRRTRHEFEEERPITANPFTACYDGTRIYVRKNGQSHSCPALTGNIGAPTPNGIYLIRRQGEAQRTTFYRDRTRWYLLEPQFTTTRYRMHLHPGNFSEGCITVTNSSCFNQLAAILNGPGTVSGPGYDGYPPGNTSGTTNPRRTVTGVGWLRVIRRTGACAFMNR